MGEKSALTNTILGLSHQFRTGTVVVLTGKKIILETYKVTIGKLSINAVLQSMIMFVKTY